MPMIDVDGLAFHVRIDGRDDAPPLMLGNSLSSNLSMWDPQMAGLAERYRVIRYDHRGHGRSAAPEGPYSMDRLGQDALAIMDALGVAQAHWCGLSMGGMTGMWLLTHAPDRIGRAVLANTAAHMGPPDLWNGRIRTATRGGMEALVDGTIQRWFKPGFAERDPAMIADVRAMILGTPVAGYQGCCAAIRDMDQREAIRGIRAPVLVIVGAHDPATTPAAGQLIAEAISGAQAVTLDGAHLSNLEQPKAFTRAVLEFLG
ncbi:3-oxoadipate enol-lactonase [Salinarimonas soli]|uniref:3-oxoadipate enol-lactonase n=1 Tax=Salinarimonas soli TaxID=1638099 RepID=A0A5B2VIL7_9HYPH|nr:3-oxoadipate enol-lactonase [Salinarimonas soli]KAA2238169.1 3-oxoadipate enol-lactonase [Salinarimonas soli]